MWLAKQPDSLGIQGTIEKAIYDITKENVKIITIWEELIQECSIRQVANFNIISSIPADKIPNALNAKLPKELYL